MAQASVSSGLGGPSLLADAGPNVRTFVPPGHRCGTWPAGPGHTADTLSGNRYLACVPGGEPRPCDEYADISPPLEHHV